MGREPKASYRMKIGLNHAIAGARHLELDTKC